jgi:hypothetical protein
MFWRNLVVGVLLAPGTSVGQTLCTPAADADPLQISEVELTTERYQEALEFLNTGVNEAVKRHATTLELQQDLSFWIPYVNSVRTVEGYVLKQRAISEGGLAIDNLCEFLRKTRWSD